MTMATELAEPVLVSMRKLQARALRILQTAEKAKDLTTALAAIREVRRGYELVAKLTGELHPAAPGEEAGGGGLNVTVVYAEKAAVQVDSQPLLEASAWQH